MSFADYRYWEEIQRKMEREDFEKSKDENLEVKAPDGWRLVGADPIPYISDKSPDTMLEIANRANIDNALKQINKAAEKGLYRVLLRKQNPTVCEALENLGYIVENNMFKTNVIWSKNDE